MEKIIRIALEAKFPGINLENLMEVLRATGNAVIAAETLLNIYEEPNIPKRALLHKIPATFESFDKYKELVKYSIDTYETKTLYFDAEKVANNCVEYDPTIGRIIMLKKDGDFKKEFQIPNKSYNTTTLKDWLDGAAKI